METGQNTPLYIRVGKCGDMWFVGKDHKQPDGTQRFSAQFICYNEDVAKEYLEYYNQKKVQPNKKAV